jgi:alkanesulfonate monooxygenase SsuD/methylene tetrahydromethanopterin reductase-like flavin-dependent oxidoreductase (luciferase family)
MLLGIECKRAAFLRATRVDDYRPRSAAGPPVPGRRSRWTRGAMQAEQIEVMRRLWTQDLVTFKGRFHTLESVNILPAPVQRPIPIWFGGSSDAVIKRAARLGDGWMPIMTPDESGEAKLAALRGHLKDFGRDPETFGLEAWIRAPRFDPDAWAAEYAAWRRLGIKIAMLYPTYDLPDFDSQIDLLKQFKEIAAG